MTLNTTNADVAYTGDNATTAFPITFDFFEDTDIEVIERIIATGVESTKTLTTDYTVTGGEGSTGTVNAVAAPAGTVTWTIRRIAEQTQGIALPVAGALPSGNVEEMADRGVMISQQIQEQLDRSLTWPKSDFSALASELPSSVDLGNKFLAFDADGEPIASAGSVDEVPVSTFMATVLDDLTAAAARATLGHGDLSILDTVDTADIDANAIDETKLKDALIADFAEVVVATGDSFLLGDIGDSGNTKRDTIQGLLDLIPSGYEFVENVTASTSSTIELGEGNIDAGFDYGIRCINVKNSADLTPANQSKLQYGTGGTPTYQTSGYVNQELKIESTTIVAAGEAITSGVGIISADNIGGTGAGETWDADILISNPAANQKHRTFSWGIGDAQSGTADIVMSFNGGKRETAEVITGFRILPGTGNFATGTFILARRAIA